MNIENTITFCLIFGTLFAWFVIWAYKIKRPIVWVIVAIPLGWVGFIFFITWFIEFAYNTSKYIINYLKNKRKMTKKYVLQKLAQLLDEEQTKEIRKDYLDLKLDSSLKNKMIKKYNIK